MQEETSCEETEGSAEVVEDQFRVVVCWVAMPWELLAFNPVGDAEVAGWTGGEMDYRQACWLFVIFFEENYRCVVSVCGKFGYFAEGEFVTVAVGGARDVVAIGEEGAEKVSFIMKS